MKHVAASRDARRGGGEVPGTQTVYLPGEDSRRVPP